MRVETLHIVGALFTLIVGTALHFVYQWSGRNPLVAPFAAVNESVFEHLKLLAVPMLVESLVEALVYGRDLPNFWAVRLLSILIGMAFITTAFYTYSGALGHSVVFVDILLFVLGVLGAYAFSLYALGTACCSSPAANIAARIGLTLLALTILVCSFYPPHIALFQDPINGTFGAK